MRNAAFSSVHRARGFTLTEALVALLVLSIGLLGVAGLQLASLRASNTSAKRSQATFLAYDIIDRMRANRDAAPAYVIAEGVAPGTTTLADTDLTTWRANIKNALPSYVDADGRTVTANGSIARAGELYTISIVWGDQDDDAHVADPAKNTGARTALRFAMTTRLNN